MPMRILITLLLLLNINTVFAQSKFIKSTQSKSAVLLQSGETKAWCPVCGMNLKMFYKTNHALEMADGSSHQYCSIRCLAVDLKTHPTQLSTAKVVNAKSERFIDAKDAYYVIGSKVPGTMTRESKLAFKSKRDAKKFSKKHDGKTIVGFDAALELSRSQMHADNAMLMKKKTSVAIPKGKKIFEKHCSDLGELPKFNSIADLKAHLKALPKCKSLNEKQLQMLALYIKSMDQSKQQGAKRKQLGRAIKVAQDKKCPVCGMFVYKYPRWAAVTNTSTDGIVSPLYFDGVKDLVKFYQSPEQWGDYANIELAEIFVTDYYQQKSIDGMKAFYVIGSDILGPMGHELIPFDSKAQAETFMGDHSGSDILKFSEISLQIIQKLDK